MASAFPAISKRYWQGGKFVPARPVNGRVWAPRDWRIHPQTFLALVLGGAGYATSYIMQRTGLTKSQIDDRLRYYSVKRADYRNGTSRIAKAFAQSAQDLAAPIMARALEASPATKQLPPT